MNFRKNKQDTPSLFGFHAVREAWLNPERTIRTLFVSDQSIKGFEATLSEAKSRGLRRPSPQIIEKQKLDRFFPPGTVHQGLALIAEPLEEVNVTDLLIRSKNHNGRMVFLMLDQVTDPHNVGAILRSASAFGASGMILQKKHAPALEGILAKTACGAVEHTPVAYETNLSRTIEELKDNGFFVYGLDERGNEGVEILLRRDVNQDKARIVLVLGAEGSGMRHLIREHCDVLLRLPTVGAIQSLNVSNAAAIALFSALSS